MKSGGACGGDWYWEGAMVELVIGRKLGGGEEV